MDNDEFIKHHIERLGDAPLWTQPRLTVSGIVGLAGPAGTGKDCAGEILANYFRMREAASIRMAFADKLYATVALMTGIPESTLRSRQLKDSYIDWASAPAGLDKWTPRRLLQYIGTEVCRQTIDDLFWVRRGTEAMQRALEGPTRESRIGFFSDVRFANEANACDLVIELRREGVEYTNEHVSARRIDAHLIADTIWISDATDYALIGQRIEDHLLARGKIAVKAASAG